jgi:CHAT domain-containing protein
MVTERVYEALGRSITGDDLKGDPRAALAAADRGGDTLGAAAALLIAGDLAAARARCRAAAAAGDAATRLLASAYDQIAMLRQLNWYPDGRGGMPEEVEGRFSAAEIRVVDSPSEAVADGEALAEAAFAIGVVAMAPSVRATVTDATRWRDEAPAWVLEQVLAVPDRVAAIPDPPPAWSAYMDWLAADLYRRARQSAQASERLAQARARSVASGDAHGVALCDLTRGDWLAAPFSSPLALNLAIVESTTDTNELDWGLEAREGSMADADLAGARAAYSGARALLRDAHAPRAIAALDLRAGYLAAAEGDFAAARELASSARASFEACGDNANAVLASIHAALAGIGAGALPEDIAAATAAGGWGATVGAVSYTVGLGLLASRRGRDWLLRHGDYERALACHRVAQAIHEGLGASVNALQARVDQGRVYGALGEIATAVSYYEAALDAAAAQRAARPALANSISRREHTLAHAVFGIAQAERDPDALDRVTRRMAALPAPQSGPEDAALADLVGSDIASAAVLSPLTRALRARDRGDEAGAVELFALAEAAAAASAAPQRDFSQAVIHRAQRRDADAIAAFDRWQLQSQPVEEQLIELLRATGADWQTEAAKHRERRLELRLTFLASVRAWPQALEAIEALEQLAGPMWWADEQPWSQLATIAAVYEGVRDWPRALDYYERAAGELESRIGQLSRDELRTALAGGAGTDSLYVQAARAAFDAAARAAAEAQRDDLRSRAFAFVERGKARALLDLIAGSAAFTRTPAGESDPRRRWRELNARLAVQRGRLAEARSRGTGPDPETLAELEAQAAEGEAAVRALETELAASDPRFLATISPRVDTLSLPAAAALMPEGTVMLQYAFTREDLLAWAISRDGMLASEHLTVAPGWLARSVEVLREACETGESGWEALARPLAAAMLEPFDAIIEAHDAITFVPFGASHALPFGVLPWRGRPLAESRALAVLPSASVLTFLSQRRLPAAPRVLAVGNPAAMAYRAPGAPRARPANPLLASAAEAEYVAARFPDATALIGPEATEEAVRTALPGRSLVHFATHGILEAIPLASSLLLADGEALTVYELMGLGLDADLVVLSACRTGQGTATNGDDVLGFVRALLGAGAGAAVVSLWPVDDDSTSLLMRAFYDALAGGTPPAVALAAAQGHVRQLDDDAARLEREILRAEVSGRARDMLPERGAHAIEDLSHPYHWAPFIYVGVQ